MDVGELAVLLSFKVDKKSVYQASSAIRDVRRVAGALLTATGLKHIVGFVKHTSHAATELISLSQAMGMTVEQTQEWGYVAEQSGSNLRELSVGMNMFLRNLRTYSEGRGSKILRDRFREIGIDAEDAKKALAGPDGLQEVLLNMSDRIKAMGTSGKTATFTQLFGVRAGRAMLADIARGSEGLKDLMSRRRAMGEITGEQAHQLRDVDNRIKDIGRSFKALGAQVIADLAPSFLKMLKDASEWIRENRDLIKNVLGAGLKAVALGFRGLGVMIQIVAGIVRGLAKDSDALTSVIFALTTALVVCAARAVIAWIEIAGPIVLVAAAIAGVTYVILKLIRHWDTVKKVVAKVIPVILAVGAAMMAIVMENPLGLILLGIIALIRHWDDFKKAVSAAANWLKDAFTAAFQWIAREARKVPILGWLGEKIGHFAGFVANQFRGDQTSSIDETVVGTHVTMPTRPAQNITVAPITHVTINGVKDAAQASGSIKQEIDRQYRHAASAVGG